LINITQQITTELLAMTDDSLGAVSTYKQSVDLQTMHLHQLRLLLTDLTHLEDLQCSHQPTALSQPSVNYHLQQQQY